MSAQNPTPIDAWDWAVAHGDWYVPAPTCECPARAAKDGCHETWCPVWKQYRDMQDRASPDVLGAARRGR